MALLQWLDWSSRERDDIFDQLAVQHDKSNVDELGIGTVRDAISDHFFPALSTIQTSAKYFLFVPWIFRQLERGSVKNESLAAWAAHRERGC